jgi:uncharacterized protein involved in outer membrane biogenesis
MDTRKAWRNIRWDKGRDHALAVYRSHRGRRIGLGMFIAIVLFGLLGFLAAPSLIRSQIASRASTALGRPVTVGDVSLNPFTLKLVIERLHIGEPDGHAAFVDVDRLTANASWASLFRAAPILDELRIEGPHVRIQRTAPQRFNFTDILERLASKPGTPDTGPARFAVSNIALHGGQIDFDDRVLDATHRIDHLELGIPFVASLPSDTDIFVQPLLAMNIDGSPLNAQGQTKPFASSRESSITFRFDHLDLARYVGFVPTPLPVAVPSGKLTGVLALNFVMAEAHPSIRLNGRLSLDDLKVTGKDGSSLLELGHGDADLTVLEPLTSRYRLGAVTLERASVRYASLPGGKSNLDALTGPGPTASAPPPDEKAAPMDVRIDSLTLKDSHIEYADLAAPTPAHLNLEHLQGTLGGLSTVKAQAAVLDVSAQMAGGSVSTRGKVDLPAGNYAGKLALKEVSLPTLMPLAPPLLNADITGGKVDAEGTLALDWHDGAKLRLTNTKAHLDGFTLVPRGGRASPVTWTSLSATITLIDLTTREARVDELLLGGLSLDVQRLANGNVDLASVMPPASSAAHPAGSDWHWSVAHLGLNDGNVTLRDVKSPGKRNAVTMSASAFSVDGLSDDLHKPLKLDLKGSLGDGAFAVAGTVKPDPLDADLTVQTTRIDVAPLQTLVTVPLNVRVASGLLSLDGQVRYSAQKDAARIGYRGKATLGRVRVLDKVTNDDFLRWTSLSASNLVVALGEGVPRLARDRKRDRASQPAGCGRQSGGAWRGIGHPGPGQSRTEDRTCRRRRRYRPGRQRPRRGYTYWPDHAEPRPAELHRQLHQAELHGGRHPAHRQDRRVRHRGECTARDPDTAGPAGQQCAGGHRRHDQSARSGGLPRYHG